MINQLRSFLYRLYAEMFPNLIKPTNIDFVITNRCNSRCIYCNAWKQPPGNEITLKQIKSAFNNPWWNSLRLITLTGGEPTLRKDIIDIFKYFHQRFPKVALRLNSNCVDYKRVCQILSEIENLKIRDFTLCISLDGTEKTHDKLRGVRGNFKSCMKVINYCEKNHVPWGASTTLTTCNYKELPHLLEIVEKNKYCIGICFRFAMSADTFFYNPQMKFNVTKNMINFVRKFNETIPDEKHINPLFIEDMLRYYETNGKVRIPCKAAGRSYLYINANGDVFSCFVKPRKMGTIFTLPKFYNSEKNRKIRDRCLKCNYFPCFTEGPVFSTYSINFFYWLRRLPRLVKKHFRRSRYIKKYVFRRFNESERCYID